MNSVGNFFDDADNHVLFLANSLKEDPSNNVVPTWSGRAQGDSKAGRLTETSLGYVGSRQLVGGTASMHPRYPLIGCLSDALFPLSSRV